MENIMITGASGFVGRHLMYILTRSYKIFGTCRNKRDGMMKLDLLDDSSVRQFIKAAKGLNIKCVVHTASELVDSEMNINEQRRVFDNNLRMAFNLTTIIKELSISVLVNCSSMAVYPNINGIFTENSIVKPSVNNEFFYGLSKFCCEEIFDNALGKTCRIVHLRLSQIYGDGLRSDRIISKMKQDIKENNCIEVFGNGERISNFIDVDVVCETIGQMIAWEDAAGVYNLGGENVSYLELAERIAGKYGNENTSIVLSDKGSKSKFILNTDKIENLIKIHGES